MLIPQPERLAKTANTWKAFHARVNERSRRGTFAFGALYGLPSLAPLISPSVSRPARADFRYLRKLGEAPATVLAVSPTTA